MLIQPIRTMRLGGVRVTVGTVADVPDAEAERAIRHGWATAAAKQPAKKGKSKADQVAEPVTEPATEARAVQPDEAAQG